MPKAAETLHENLEAWAADAGVSPKTVVWIYLCRPDFLKLRAELRAADTWRNGYAKDATWKPGPQLNGVRVRIDPCKDPDYLAGEIPYTVGSRGIEVDGAHLVYPDTSEKEAAFDKTTLVVGDTILAAP